MGWFDDGNSHELCLKCHYSWFISWLLYIFSSHKAGDYDSCDGITATDCIICNGDKNRTLINGNTCMC